jgi:hypothetical protein
MTRLVMVAAGELEPLLEPLPDEDLPDAVERERERLSAA